MTQAYSPPEGSPSKLIQASRIFTLIHTDIRCKRISSGVFTIAPKFLQLDASPFAEDDPVTKYHDRVKELSGKRQKVVPLTIPYGISLPRTYVKIQGMKADLRNLRRKVIHVRNERVGRIYMMPTACIFHPAESWVPRHHIPHTRNKGGLKPHWESRILSY